GTCCLSPALYAPHNMSTAMYHFIIFRFFMLGRAFSRGSWSLLAIFSGGPQETRKYITVHVRGSPGIGGACTGRLKSPRLTGSISRKRFPRKRKWAFFSFIIFSSSLFSFYPPSFFFFYLPLLLRAMIQVCLCFSFPLEVVSRGFP
ncbi:unnamed protein product, partial [Pylaiella littoralis]